MMHVRVGVQWALMELSAKCAYDITSWVFVACDKM